MLLLGDFTPMLLGRSDDPFIVNRYFRLNKRFVGFLSWDPGDEQNPGVYKPSDSQFVWDPISFDSFLQFPALLRSVQLFFSPQDSNRTLELSRFVFNLCFQYLG